MPLRKADTMRSYLIRSITRPIRWWNQVPWSSNRLMRPSDRLLSSLIIAACAIGALGIPVSAAIGTSVYTSGRARIEQQYNTYRQWNGTVANTSPSVPSTPEIPANPIGAETKVAGAARKVVTWTVNGNSRTEPVIAHFGAHAGDTIKVWTNGNGDQVPPPPETSIAAVDGVAAAIVLYGATVFAMCMMISAARTMIGWHNDRMWDMEWKNKFQQQA